MQTIRVVTLNMWGEQPPLESRMRGIVAGLAKLQPDVVALQEVREIPNVLENQAAGIARSLGMELHYAPATSWGGGDEGLAILSKFPIRERFARELPHATADERRIVLGATLDTPAGAFSAFTTHLNYRLHHGAIREDQISAGEALVAEVASELPKVYMGDFNATPDSDEIRYLRGLHSISGKRVFYQDAFERRHPHDPGYTWARANPFTERLRWLALDRRIDYIFVSAMRKDGRGVVQDCRIVLDHPDAEGCFPSDHFGLMADVQVSPLASDA
jgi:endonuclease/exonuclease/phosphatase family metal-dependent hydrolase